ncbi:MAG: hypothetical protein ACOCQU_00510 [Halolamina sp.]
MGQQLAQGQNAPQQIDQQPGIQPQAAPQLAEQSPTNQPVGAQQPGQEFHQQPTQQQAADAPPVAPFAVGVPGGPEAQQPFGGYQQSIGATAQRPVGSQASPMEQGPHAMVPPGELAGQPSALYPEAFADHLTPEARDCLDDCIDVSQVAAWCSDRCLEEGSQYARCSRLCNEAATLGAVTAEFIARDAMSLPTIVDAYVETAQRAVDELGKFDTPHTNEAEMVIDRSIESSLDALETL